MRPWQLNCSKKEDDALPPSPPASTDEENGDERFSRRMKYPQFNHKVADKDIRFKVSDRFESKLKLRQVVIDYAVAQCRGVRIIRCDAQSAQAICHHGIYGHRK